MRKYVALAAVVLAAVVVAWLLRFGCDDAYISYVYARNLIYGDGLTWFGTRIEGYTNFAWVLWSAGGLSLGIDPLLWAWVGSLGAMATTLVLIYQLGLLRTTSQVAALCVVGMLASNYTFLAFGTSGLETMLQCALLTGALYEVERLRRADAIRPRRLMLLSVLAALALWTRLDSAVYLAVIGCVAVVHLVRTRAGLVAWLAAAGPAFVLVGGWLAWKLVYYSDLLPNTFHAKVTISTVTIASAASYTAAFSTEYLLWIPLAATAVLAFVRRAFTPKLPAALTIVWVAYVIVIGGDFMEFRFFVPIMPALFLVFAEVVGADGAPVRVAPRLRAIALVALLAAFSVRHAVSYEPNTNTGDSIPGLATFYGLVQDNDWSRLGTPIGDVLDGTDAIIACNGAGAIPYYADIPTIDQLGLNDRWVARHGARPPSAYTRPGHQRFATEQYLVDRKVTFVIGTPRLVERGFMTQIGLSRQIVRWFVSVLGVTRVVMPDLVIIVAVPVSENRSLLMWYLGPTPAITERIRAAGWEMRAFRPRPTPAG